MLILRLQLLIKRTAVENNILHHRHLAEQYVCVCVCFWTDEPYVIEPDARVFTSERERVTDVQCVEESITADTHTHKGQMSRKSVRFTKAKREREWLASECSTSTQMWEASPDVSSLLLISSFSSFVDLWRPFNLLLLPPSGWPYGEQRHAICSIEYMCLYVCLHMCIYARFFCEKRLTDEVY